MEEDLNGLALERTQLRRHRKGELRPTVCVEVALRLHSRNRCATARAQPGRESIEAGACCCLAVNKWDGEALSRMCEAANSGLYSLVFDTGKRFILEKTKR